ncbi:unnamed protein product [Gordionus sp. m RMFG-2023]
MHIEYVVKLKDLILNDEDILFVCGNCKELGYWDPSNAYKLNKKYNNQGIEQWSGKINILIKDTIQYRYFVASLVTSADIKENNFIIKYWENGSISRVYDPNSNIRIINDVFGFCNGEKIIDMGWLLLDTLTQITIKNLHISEIVGNKFEICPNSYFIKLSQTNLNNIDKGIINDHNILIQSLDQNETHNIKQSKYGKHYNNGQYFTYQIRSFPYLKKNYLTFTIYNIPKHHTDLISNDLYQVAISTPFDIDSYHSIYPITNNAHTIQSGSKQTIFDTENCPSRGSKKLLLYESDCLNRSSKKGDDLNGVSKILSSVIGYIEFEYLVVKPTLFIKELNLMNSFNKKLDINDLDVGHRGMGQSFRTKNPALLMENTIASLMCAYEKGSNFVEFDVQLTKDQIPFLYHDFNVVISILKNPPNFNDGATFYEDFIKIGTHQTTLHQLKTWQLHHETLLDKQTQNLHPNSFTNLINNSEDSNCSDNSSLSYTINQSPNKIDSNQYSKSYSDALKKSTLLPSENLSVPDDNEIINLLRKEEQIAFNDNKKEDIKKGENEISQNLKSQFNVFPTLKDVMEKLDVNLGFNVELKYPLLFEDNTHESIDGQYLDLNIYCDAILTTLFDSARKFDKKRNLIFSSFHPDVCLMLRYKQNRYPVFLCFDNNPSNDPFFKDARTKNLSFAINYCLGNGLAGLSLNCKTLLKEPEITDMARELNLIILVWGSEASDRNIRETLKKMGVNGIIYDRN